MPRYLTFYLIPQKSQALKKASTRGKQVLQVERWHLHLENVKKMNYIQDSNSLMNKM